MRKTNHVLSAAALTQVNEPITKVTHIMAKSDGTEFRIVGTLVVGMSETAVDYYVHRRQSPAHDWELLSRDPHPDWRTMSVDEYRQRGRSPLLQALTFPELFKLCRVLKLLGQPMTARDTFHLAATFAEATV